MSVVIDSNAPYSTEFPLNSTGDAVYMTAEDEVLGNVFAIVYRAHRGNPKLSVILIGAHGTSGYVDMTLDRTSRYFGACRGLAPSHYKSPVRRALAIAAMRTYATMDKPLKQRFRGMCDESAAGLLGSRFRLVYGKFPGAIGSRVLEAGLICPKKIEHSIVDIVYEDSDLTIHQNNELVYLIGEQLEQLFDPLSEYSPEPTERLYNPPALPANEPNTPVASSSGAPPPSSTVPVGSLDNEPKVVQDICEELYLMQAHARGDILDLLQTILIPLRVEALKGRFPKISIARLNSVFPPTIDELFRINNIFYESLRSALPFGAFEVMKACGATIPYFFRACMRHVAATQNFSTLLAELLEDVPEVEPFIKAASSDNNKIERVIRNPLHFSSIKSILERLVKTKQWESDEQRKMVDEFFSIAAGTADAFVNKEGGAVGAAGAANNGAPSPYDHYATGPGNKHSTAGKVLGEIAQDWPFELEYNWVNRRVVSVFDAVDVLEPNDSLRQLHIVFIIFTDSLVVCRPSEPIPLASLSGLHLPSVGDMLMHAMLNEAPLDKNLPPLKVIAWAPILDVHFASYDKQHLYVYSPGIVGSYRLLQPDSDSNNLVSLLAKAKITTKTQPFHLFKVSGKESSIFSTVQEIAGYRNETNRTNIALFLSTPVTERTLSEFGLMGAVSLQLNSNDDTIVAVRVISRMRYSADFKVRKSNLQELVVNELTYLMTLSLSSQNSSMLDVIITSNRLVVNRLIKWASFTDKNSPIRKGHRRPPNKIHPNGQVPSKAQRKMEQSRVQADKGSVVINSSANPKADTNSDAETSGSRLFVVHNDSADSITHLNRNLRKLPGKIPPKSRDFERKPNEEPTMLDKDPSIDVDAENSYNSLSSRYSDPEDTHDLDRSHSDQSIEEAEQRDVDNWYHQLHHSRHDDESLSSGLSDGDMTSDSLRRSNSNSSSIQIGTFFDPSVSNLYNRNAGRAFPRIESDMASHTLRNGIHSRQETESSFETIATLQDSVASTEESFNSGNITVSDQDENEDFSYLAALVDATSFSSKMSEIERGGVYPDLRETSLVRLGSYILRNEKSQRDIPTASLRTIPESRTVEDFDFADEATPTLHSGKFSAAPSNSPSLSGVCQKGAAATTDAAATTPVAPTASSETGSFTPFADVERANWHPKVVKSGTTAQVSGLLPGARHYRPDEEDSFDDEDGHELAKQYLAWAESSGRPISMISTKTINEFLQDSPKRDSKRLSAQQIMNLKGDFLQRDATKAAVPQSTSQMSFRRMVMSSSLHTLQLASFIVQVDQKELTSPADLVEHLNNLKDFATSIYRVRVTNPDIETIIRRQLCGYYFLLVKYECQQLALGLLEIEWFRRTRIAELHGDLVPQLWKF